MGALRPSVGDTALPGAAGEYFTAIVQTLPAETIEVPEEFTVQPLMLPREYSVKPGAMEIDVIGTAVFTVSMTFCEVDWPTTVDGNVVLATVNVGVTLQACGSTPSKASAAVTGPMARLNDGETLREGNRKPTIMNLLSFGETILCKSTTRLKGRGGSGPCRFACPG
jgi:hypothetical protein